MFRSLFQDHLQGSSFALSAPTTLQLHASSFVCIGMWSYALYLYVYPVYLPVCCLVVQSLLCYMLSGRGLCDELITRPEESYRL
jgi:peptidoglycan/LPS O-acetylase OafA/YrhL